MEWNGDEHGTAVIRPGDGTGFAWVAPRRTYCDRGHWDWGYQSLPALPGAPSYYFMELSTAVEEVALWLAQAQPTGTLEPGSPVLAVNSGGLRSLDTDDTMPVWKQSPDGGIECAVKNGDESMRMSIRPVKTGFEFNLEGLTSIDTADRFPRLYRNAQTAMREAGLFAQWRLIGMPAQVPGRLPASFNHQVDTHVAQAIQAQSATPGPRPSVPRP